MTVFSSLHRRVLAALLFATSLPVLAQIADDDLEHTSSLGMKFVTVTGTPAYIATHETRVSDWQAFISASGREWTYKPHFNQGPDHPAVGITLEDARAFCSWLTDQERAEGKLTTSQSYRLPTRSDWDAAIGLLRMRKLDLTVDEKVTDERTFPWGMDWPPPARTGNFAEGEIPGYEDGFPFTSPVGQFKPTPEGIYDLTGNVWEWCWDPQIRAEQVGVLRGGSWAYFRQECLRSDYIYVVPVDLRMPTVGFRCVYEDTQRTATLLASVEKIKAEVRTQRREEIVGGKVAAADVAAMKEKLTGSTSTSNIPDPSTLKPAAAGQGYTNVLGMPLVPLKDTSLLIGATEVRVQDYETWLKETRRTWEKKPPFLTSGAHPAVSVSWTDAIAFCTWLTERDRAANLIPAGARYRLPTDLEWSRAAGLTDEQGADPAERDLKKTAHYPWSAEGVFPPPAATTNLDTTRIPGYRDSFSYTAPVDSESANAQGISGLGGNASEWCQDVWPGSPDERVIRGGSWLGSDPEQLRTGTRQHSTATTLSTNIGFRVVLELPAP